MADKPEATLAMYRRAPQLHQLQPILLPSMPDFKFRDWVKAGSPPETAPNTQLNNQLPLSDKMSVDFSDVGLQGASTAPTAPGLPNLDDLVFFGTSFSACNLLGKPAFLFNPTDNSYCKVNLDNQRTVLPRSPSKKFVCPRNPARVFKKPDAFVKPESKSFVGRRSRKQSFLSKKSQEGIRPPSAFEDSQSYSTKAPNPSQNYIKPYLS